jgi:hypothetical protein
MKPDSQAKPDFAALNRRDALRLAGSFVAFFGMEYRVAYGMDDPASGGEGLKEDRQSTKERYSAFDRRNDSSGDIARQRSDLAAILLAGQRAPRCEIGFVDAGLLQTAVASGRATRLLGEMGGRLSDEHNEKLASRGRDPLETYVRNLQAKLPDDVKVSIGGQWGKAFAFGRPGKTFIFVNPTTDYTNKATGFSVTIGAGLTEGALLNVSYMSGRYGLSAGAFLAVSTGHAVQVTMSVSDLVRGALTLSEAVSSPLASKSGPSGVQVGVDVRPMELLYDTLANVLGPLSDYRNFQSPMSNF